MQTMFERNDGAKILFDHEEQDHLGYTIIYGAIYLNGKTYEPQPLEQILAHGYWEATNLVKSVSLKYSPDQPRDENGRFGEGSSAKVAADVSKQEWLAAIDKINMADIEQMRPGDKYGDSFVERLAQLAGINGKPTLVESQYDLTGEPMHRGISDEKAEDMWGPVKPDGERDFFPGERTSYRVYMDEFLHGDTSRFSSGNYGSGAYFSTSYSEAIGYSKLNPVDDVRIQDGEVLTGGFTADARILETSHNTWDDDMEGLYAQFKAVYPDVKEIAGLDIEHSIATKAIMLGWDGIKVAGASGTTGGDYFVVYNRGALEMVGK